MSTEEIFHIMQKLVSEQFTVKMTDITLETSFQEDLGADSLDLVELVMALEEEFDIGEAQEEELAKLKTVGDVVNYLEEKLK